MTILHRGKIFMFSDETVKNFQDWTKRDMTDTDELDLLIISTCDLWNAEIKQVEEYIQKTPTEYITNAILEEVNYQIELFKPIEGSIEDGIAEEIIADEDLMRKIAQKEVMPDVIYDIYPPGWMSVEKFMEIKRLADAKYGAETSETSCVILKSFS